MSIISKIVDLNSLHEELTGEKLKTLKLHWSYKEAFEKEVDFMFTGLNSCFIDGIEISFTKKPKPEPQSYMWGREAAEIQIFPRDQNENYV